MKKPVLLVEADNAYRYVLARELRSNGLDVLDVRLAMEALDHLDRNPGIGMAVVDMRMPQNNLTGLAFARMMRHRNREARVVLMTACAEYFDHPETEPFGEILLKTADTAALAVRILDRLGLRRPPPGSNNRPRP